MACSPRIHGGCDAREKAEENERDPDGMLNFHDKNVGDEAEEGDIEGPDSIEVCRQGRSIELIGVLGDDHPVVSDEEQGPVGERRCNRVRSFNRRQPERPRTHR